VFAHGHKFGGHALYIKEGKLKYVYSFVGMTEQMITSSENVPTGKAVFGVEFVKEKQETVGGSRIPNAVTGTATLYINDKKVGELKNMKAQVGKFALTGEGLNIGRDGSANVTDDYPGKQPWAFSGGTIKQVIVDVSGEPYVDLEKEALAMMKRE
jgi:arylsulfatase